MKTSEDIRTAKVGRVHFNPIDGVSFTVLDEQGIEEVRNGEERIGFLPTWYVDTCWPL